MQSILKRIGFTKEFLREEIYWIPSKERGPVVALVGGGVPLTNQSVRFAPSPDGALCFCAGARTELVSASVSRNREGKLHVARGPTVPGPSQSVVQMTGWTTARSSRG